MTQLHGQIVLLAVFVLPLILTAGFLVRRLHKLLFNLAPWSALPGLLVSIFADERHVEIPWLLLGSHFGYTVEGVPQAGAIAASSPGVLGVVEWVWDKTRRWIPDSGPDPYAGWSGCRHSLRHL